MAPGDPARKNAARRIDALGGTHHHHDGCQMVALHTFSELYGRSVEINPDTTNCLQAIEQLRTA